MQVVLNRKFVNTRIRHEPQQQKNRIYKLMQIHEQIFNFLNLKENKTLITISISIKYF